MYARKGENSEGRSPDGDTSPFPPREKLPALYPPRNYVPGARSVSAQLSCVRFAQRQRAKGGNWLSESAGDGLLRASTMRFGQKRRDGFAHDIGTMCIYLPLVLAEGMRAERWRIARPEYRADRSIKRVCYKRRRMARSAVGPVIKKKERR